MLCTVSCKSLDVPSIDMLMEPVCAPWLDGIRD
jgi:hypothetical protein